MIKIWLITIVLALTIKPTYRVKKKHTPIGKVELAAVLRDGHYAVFGDFPSKERLQVAWAQVALENGQGYMTYNHNLGKITSSKYKPYYVQRNRFRSLKNFQDGAKLYWKVVDRLCSKSLQYFDNGRPNAAAQQLHSCGYYGADAKLYGKEMSKLYRREAIVAVSQLTRYSDD